MPPADNDHWIPFSGGRLRATLHLPAHSAPPYPAVIGVHGLLSHRQSQKQVRLAGLCTAIGIAYLRFDHRGCGESSGDLGRDTSLPGRVEDLKTVWGNLTRRTCIDPQRMGLFGSSFGGSVALAFASARPVSAVVTLAAPLLSRPLLNIPPEALPANLPSSLRGAERQFDLTPLIPTVSRLLCCHGQEDAIVPVAHARQINALAAKPKALLILRGADHRISDPAQRTLLLEKARAWFSRYLVSSPSRSAGPPAR